MRADTLTGAGRAVRERVESLTDLLAEPPYDALEQAELDDLVASLDPIARRLRAAGSS